MDYGAVLAALAGRGIRFAVAGGFACLAHGVVRVTMDLDLIVDLRDDNLEALWDTLSELGFFTQQPIQRADAVRADVLAELARQKGMQAISWVHGRQPFVIVDLLVGPTFRWSPELYQAVEVFGVRVPVVRREELIRL